MMRGVFARILLWFWLSLVLVALALELTIAATSTPVEIRVQRFSDGALGSRAREAVAILDRDGPPKVARFLEGLERTTRMHAVLLDADGHDVAGHPVPRKAAAVAARALATGETEMDTDGQAAVKARAVTIGGERRYVLVATLPVGLMRLVHDGPTAQALRLLAVLVTAAAACYGLARYVTRPLAVLRSTTHTLARGDLSVRVGSTMGRRTDEFAELGRDFDRMAERLETLVTAERRLLRDISHELRSPLARLNVALGVARQHAGDDQAVLDRIEREADRLNTLIGQLLMLARLESGTLTPERVVVDLEAIVRDVAEDAAFEAQGRGRRVQIVETREDVRVGDEQLGAGAQHHDVLLGIEREDGADLLPGVVVVGRPSGPRAAHEGEAKRERDRERRAPAHAMVLLSSAVGRAACFRCTRARRARTLRVRQEV